MKSSRSDKRLRRVLWAPMNLVESLLVGVIMSLLAATAGLSLPVRPEPWHGGGSVEIGQEISTDR